MDGSTRKAMMLWAWAVTAFGAVLIGGGFAPTDGAVRALYALIAGTTPRMDAALRFSVGLMGAVTLGWGLTVLAVASVSDGFDLATARRLWRRIGLAIGLWYAIDSTISIATGYALNAASNTVLLAAFVLILARGGMLASGADAGRGAARAAG